MAEKPCKMGGPLPEALQGAPPPSAYQDTRAALSEAAKNTPPQPTGTGAPAMMKTTKRPCPRRARKGAESWAPSGWRGFGSAPSKSPPKLSGARVNRLPGQKPEPQGPKPPCRLVGSRQKPSNYMRGNFFHEGKNLRGCNRNRPARLGNQPGFERRGNDKKTAATTLVTFV